MGVIKDMGEKGPSRSSWCQILRRHRILESEIHHFFWLDRSPTGRLDAPLNCTRPYYLRLFPLISVNFKISSPNQVKVVLISSSFATRTQQSGSGAPVCQLHVGQKKKIAEQSKVGNQNRPIFWRSLQSFARCVVSPHSLHEPPFGYTPLPLFLGHEPARWPRLEHTKHDAKGKDASGSGG